MFRSSQVQMDRSRLDRICSSARSILGHIHYVPSAPSPTKLSLSLPDPEAITGDLVQAGAKHAALLSAAYMHRATALKTDFERVMNGAINKCLNTGPWADVREHVSSLHSTYTAMYQRTLAQWIETIADLSGQRSASFTTQSTSGSTHLVGKRRPFKQDVSTILEEGFSINPYPSRYEKVGLAYSTGMGYQQIHVWFQNRRNRARREGKSPQRRTFVEIPCYSSMPPDCSVFEQDNSQLATSEETAEPPVAMCSLQIDRAPHAFPNVFPPVCDYEPFPILRGPQIFDTPWPRRITTELRRNGADNDPVDIQQLCVLFTRLSLTDGQIRSTPSAPKLSTQARRLRHHFAACFPSLVLPPTAPLPALVRVTVTVGANVEETSRPPARYLSLSKHAISVTQPTVSFGARQLGNSSSTFPHRAASSLSTIARDLTHPYISHIPSRSKPWRSAPSHLSSQVSVASDDSCPSRASSASLESPPPLTPPQLSVELPRSRKDPSPDLVFSPSRELDHLFSDSDAPILTTLHNRQPQIVQ